MTEKKQLLLLLLWTAIAAGVRFTHLEAKPLWTDEFSTLVFSLGNSFQGVPLDRAIDLDTLLSPLQRRPDASIGDVLHHLLGESNHPPVYFVVAHLWMRLWELSTENLVWVARSLPAFCGAVAVPAIYGLGRLAFQSRLVGQCAAAMMAVSPYGIYLAQEARHYTLGVLLVIASLSCFAVAMRLLHQQKRLPIGLTLGWVAINSLGIAIHYFFALTLCAEGLAAIAFSVLRSGFSLNLRSQFYTLKPIWGVAAGSLISGLVWLPVWQNGYGTELTRWIQSERQPLDWINPIFQSLAGWITMVSLLPVESSQIPIVIVSALGMILFFIATLPILYEGVRTCLEKPESRLATGILGGVVLGAIALFFGFAYCLGIDLTRGARYNFVYFPAVIVIVGAGLAIIFNRSIVKSKFFKLPSLILSGKQAVLLIWLMGLVSSMTVVSNLGYQKYYQPEQLVSLIQQQQVPTLIATTQTTHVEIGELMGIGWQWQKEKTTVSPPLFLLAGLHREQPEITANTLEKTLAQLKRPLDVWLVNFQAPVNLQKQQCIKSSQTITHIDGYSYQAYHCLEEKGAIPNSG